MQRTAAYELAVASLRGKGEMNSQIEKIHGFFCDIEDWLGSADLQDAATLVTYVHAALIFNQITMEAEQVNSFRKKTSELLDKQIVEAQGPGRRSSLYRIKGYLSIVPKQVGDEPSFEEGLEDWHSMLDEAEKTPLFPIEDFADFISEQTVIFGLHSNFITLIDRIDPLVAKHAGKAAAGERMFARAMAYYEQDETVYAIRELHKVKLSWFSGDTMSRFQFVMQMLSNCYLELHLPYAAKYYALSAAHIASHSDNEEVAGYLSKMLIAASDADDAVGNSLSFIQLVLLAVEAHCRLDKDPLDLDTHPNLKVNLEKIAALRGLAIWSTSEALVAVDTALEIWPNELRDPIVAASEDSESFWQTATDEEIKTNIRECFLGVPFGDLQPTQNVTWNALGIFWTVKFENTYSLRPFAEEFLAQFQIALAVFAGTELGLLPTNVNLQLEVRKKNSKL